MSSFKGEDRNPVFDANDTDFYYLSRAERLFQRLQEQRPQSGAIGGDDPVHEASRPVPDPRAKTARSRSRYDGELYTMTPGSEPQKVVVRIGADGRDAIEKILPINGGMTDAKLAPNGKEFAFVFRGEIFVSSIDGKFVKRITNTPWQERPCQLQPRRPDAGVCRGKGQQLERLYVVDRLVRSEPYFFVSTVLKAEAVVATAAEEFQPAFSPDGKEIAYLENRQTLKVYNLASKQSRTVLPARSQLLLRRRRSVLLVVARFEVAARPVRSQGTDVRSGGRARRRRWQLGGSQPHAKRLRRCPPKWAMDGKMMIWGTTRDGALSQGGGAVSGDVYGMYFTKAAYDRAKLSKEEFALVKEREDKEKRRKPTRRPNEQPGREAIGTGGKTGQPDRD